MGGGEQLILEPIAPKLRPMLILDVDEGCGENAAVIFGDTGHVSDKSPRNTPTYNITLSVSFQAWPVRCTEVACSLCVLGSVGQTSARFLFRPVDEGGAGLRGAFSRDFCHRLYNDWKLATERTGIWGSGLRLFLKISPNSTSGCGTCLLISPAPWCRRSVVHEHLLPRPWHANRGPRVRALHLQFV
jgi:hypothetical protein